MQPVFVYVYGGCGTFLAPAVYDWNHPVSGNAHRFILFLAQQLDASDEERALSELHKFGFASPEILEGRPIHVEALNLPTMQAFHKHYEGALQEGVSLVWYPQVVTDSEAN